jgi:peptidoglycan/xylan/chitin deacetylase (PgdA/CDA1 family)
MLWYFQEVVAIALNLTMIPFVLRELVNNNKVTIVNYHNPSDECFERHLQLLRHRYNIISMDRLQECFKSRTFESLPKKALVITFDDGHCGNAKLFGILKKYNMPSVIYVVSAITSTNRKFWWQLGLKKSRLRKLKKIPNNEREHWLKEHCGYTIDREYRERSALTDSELQNYVEHGGTIGGHSMSHPNLRMCDDKTLSKEIDESKEALETKTTGHIKYFAYPNGYWDKRVKEAVISAGYVNARTIDFGWVSPDSDPYALPCIGIGDNAGIYKVLCQASGLWHIIFRTQKLTI